MKKKISCKDCPTKCCDEATLKKFEGNINDPEPDDLPTGALIYIEGMWWKKKKNGKWRCTAFDVKKGICKMYAHRPPICRWFRCPGGKKGKPARMPDNSYRLRVTAYNIYLSVPGKG